MTRRKIRKPGTLLAAVLLSEKNNPPESECVTRPMTPEEWAKYGPVNPGKRERSIQNANRRKLVRESCKPELVEKPACS